MRAAWAARGRAPVAQCAWCVLLVFLSSTALDAAQVGCIGPRTLGELRRTRFGDDYDKYTRPELARNGSAPDRASLQFHVVSLWEVSDLERTFGLDIWLRQKWVDWRLQYPSEAEGGCIPAGDHRQGFPLSTIDELWTPDIYIENLVDSTTTAGSFWIYPDGTVAYVRQMRLRLYCHGMKLDQMPIDTKLCKVQIGTWLHDAAQLSLDFYDAGPAASERGAVTVDMGASLGEHGTFGWELENAYAIDNIDATQFGSTQLEPVLAIAFKMTRHSDFFVSSRRARFEPVLHSAHLPEQKTT